MQYSFQNDHYRYEQVGLADLAECANHILLHTAHFVNVLEAPMGSGKTTLTNALLKAWGSEDHGSSPTFGLIEEHHGPQGRFYHLDAYRLEDEEEAYDFGLDEYLEDGDPIWIEWAGKVRSLLPDKVGVVYIEAEELDHRTILFFPSASVNEIQWNDE